MNKILHKKLFYILVLLMVFIFIFPMKTVIAEWQTGLYTNDTMPNADIEKINNSVGFKLTAYGGSTLGTPNPSGGDFTYRDFSKVNDKYGWVEYDYQGATYVVVAAATYSLFDDSSGPYTWHDYIHYFHAGHKYGSNYETFQFKFDPNDSGYSKVNDSNVYNAIVLDECGASMRVGENGAQIIDIYMGLDGESLGNDAIFNQCKILISSDGSFTPNAESTTDQETSGNFREKLDVEMYTTVGDAIQKFLNGIISNSDIRKIKDINLSKSEIDSNEDLKNQLDVKLPGEISESTGSEEESRKTIFFSNTAYSKEGELIEIYSQETKIPVIPADLYGMSVGKVALFDTNFFNPNTENNNSIWLKFKNLVSYFSYSAITIALMLLVFVGIRRIITLIFKLNYTEDIQDIYKSKTIIENIVPSLFLVVFIFLIIIIMQGLYDWAIEYLVNDNNSIYPIRLNVSGVYSFNTNFMGALRYKVSTADIDGAKLWAFIYYAITIWVNFAYMIFMMIRVILIGILVMLAPFVAVVSMNREDLKRDSFVFRWLQPAVWLKRYMLFLWMPFFVACITKIMFSI